MPASYAFFDFDGTLISGDSILLFMRYAWRHKLCSAFDLLRFAYAGGLFTLGLYSPKRAKETALRFLKGQPRSRYAEAAQGFCREVLLPRLYPQGVEAVKRHLAAGDRVVLVSASPAFYLQPLQEMLGFETVLGTVFAVDDNDRFTGKITGQNCRDEEKPARILQYLAETGTEMDAEASWAYGDSTHDLPMLSMVGHACAVNPGTKLREALHNVNGAAVLYWKETPRRCALP